MLCYAAIRPARAVWRLRRRGSPYAHVIGDQMGWERGRSLLRLLFFILPFQSVEVGYNLLGRDVGHELEALALDAGLGLYPWSPSAGGALSGRHMAVVSSVIVGASRMGQLRDNLGAACLGLSAEDRALLDEMTAPTPLYPGCYGAKFADPAARDMLR